MGKFQAQVEYFLSVISKVFQKRNSLLSIIFFILIFSIFIVAGVNQIRRLAVSNQKIRFEECSKNFCKAPVLYCKKYWNRKKYNSYFLNIHQKIQKEMVTFPIQKEYHHQISYVDSWDFPRDMGDRGHEGCDIMHIENERGTIPIVSAADGVVTNIGWLTLGGYRIGITSNEGIYYYYAHLYSYAPNLKKGDVVYAGQLLGFMGDSGEGEEGTVGMFDVHLHFGIYFYDEEGNQISVNPYEYLIMEF